MAKKKEVFDTTRALELIDEIEYDLIFRLRFSISNNICTEEDGINLIQIDNKPICYPKGSYIENYNIVNFDPFFNRKLMSFLFQRYVYIYMSENPGIEINSYSLAYNLMDTRKMFAICKTNRGDIQSNLFTNDIICWIDLLYKMDRSPYPIQDLVYLDEAITYIRKVGTDGTE